MGELNGNNLYRVFWLKDGKLHIKQFDHYTTTKQFIRTLRLEKSPDGVSVYPPYFTYKFCEVKQTWRKHRFWQHKIEVIERMLAHEESAIL